MTRVYCDHCRREFSNGEVRHNVQASLYDLTNNSDIEVLCRWCLTDLIHVIKAYFRSSR